MKSCFLLRYVLPFMLGAFLWLVEANAGTLTKEPDPCVGSWVTWRVDWTGPWSSLTRHLKDAPTNQGPWTTKLSGISDSDCLHPAPHLRYYKVVSCPFLCSDDSNKLWVPAQSCN